MHQSYSALSGMERPPVWREFGPSFGQIMPLYLDGYEDEPCQRDN